MARKIALLILGLGLPVSAEAHVGHLADVGGHDHVIAGIAIGIAIAIGLAGVLAGTREDKEASTEEECNEPEPREA